jgi:hypothetical protein
METALREPSGPDAGCATAPAPPPPAPASPAKVVPERSAGVASPLGEADYAAVRQAVVDRRAVQRACHTALSSAIVTLLIGASSFPFVLLWPSASSLFIVAGISAIGVMEFLGYRRLRKADPAAPKALAVNQLAFLGLIVVYCLGQMVGFSVDDAKAAALSPEVRAQLNAMPSMAEGIDRMIERWAPLLTYGFYSLVIVLSVAFQGGMALYYYTRRRHVEAFNQKTPPWIRRLFVEAGV